MMKITKKAKILTASISGISVITMMAVLLIMTPSNLPPNGNTNNPDDPTNSPNDLIVSVPSASDITDGSAEQSSKELMDNDLIQLDVGGNPNNEPSKKTNPSDFVETSNSITSTSTNPTQAIQPKPTSTQQKPPSVGVTIIPDPTEPKDTSPTPDNPEDQASPTGWTPPPPGVGTGELIWEGAENIKIDISPSVETLQRDVGLLVGNNLLNAGYNSIYPNASPRDLVEEAIMNYARTGIITLNPANYGLPEVVGYYNVKLPATGTNVVEAGEYISECMKVDPVFNEKIETVFAIPKDGWLSVYQKDGYFYILFVVVDIGYSSFG